MNSSRGSKLHLLAFDQSDDVTLALVRTYVIEALTNQEPRVEIRDFELQRESDHEVRVKIYLRKRELPVQDFDLEFILERS